MKFNGRQPRACTQSSDMRDCLYGGVLLDVIQSVARVSVITPNAHSTIKRSYAVLVPLADSPI